MSECYRRLSEDLPEGDSAGAKFHADPRKVKAWVDALPRANAAVSQQQLSQALENLAAQTLSGGQRLAALEELRPAVLEQAGLLESQYAGSPLPLASEQNRAAKSAESFQLALAHGYRQAACELCGSSGSVPFLRGGSVAQALVRAATHYSRCLVLAWRIYHPARPGAWQGLHRVYRFAGEVKLDTKTVEDASASAAGSRDVLSIYIQTLLVAITNPYGYGQSEQDAMWPLVLAYVGRCGLHSSPPHDHAPALPDDSDHAPGAERNDEDASLWLDLRPFIDDVDRALEQLSEGFSELVPGRGASLRLSEGELLRLKRAFGLLSARRFPRLPATHTIGTVAGITTLHYYLSGQRDFDTFLRQSTQAGVHRLSRAAWTNGGGDAQRLPRLVAQVMDQSLGGYRLVWRNHEQFRVRVGELIGLTFADVEETPEWMVAIVRWLIYSFDGSLSAGVELLSLRSAAVALRTETAAETGAGEGALRAVELSLDHGERRFLVRAGLDGCGERLEIVVDAESERTGEATVVREHLENHRLVMNTGEYVIIQASSSGPGAKP